MSPHIFLFRLRNILVSYQAVPLTFYNKIALMTKRECYELQHRLQQWTYKRLTFL